MIIRFALQSDVSLIARLYIRNHKTTYKNLLPAEYFEALTEEYANEKWSAYIANENNKIWVAFEGDAFLGFAASMPDEGLKDVWYLDSLHVCEKARGRGVGTMLIKATGKYAFDNGYEKMSICIVKGNDKAGALYRNLGANHYKDFIGKLSLSEKLLWHDLKIFDDK